MRSDQIKLSKPQLINFVDNAVKNTVSGGLANLFVNITFDDPVVLDDCGVHADIFEDVNFDLVSLPIFRRRVVYPEIPTFKDVTGNNVTNGGEYRQTDYYGSLQKLPQVPTKSIQLTFSIVNDLSTGIQISQIRYWLQVRKVLTL